MQLTTKWVSDLRSLLLCGCSSKIIKLYIKPAVNICMNLVVFIADLLRCHSLLYSLYGEMDNELRAILKAFKKFPDHSKNDCYQNDANHKQNSPLLLQLDIFNILKKIITRWSSWESSKYKWAKIIPWSQLQFHIRLFHKYKVYCSFEVDRTWKTKKSSWQQ